MTLIFILIFYNHATFCNLFIIYREISDKKELYKRLRIRPEEEKIDVLMIVNTETIPVVLIFFLEILLQMDI